MTHTAAPADDGSQTLTHTTDGQDAAPLAFLRHHQTWPGAPPGRALDGQATGTKPWHLLLTSVMEVSDEMPSVIIPLLYFTSTPIASYIINSPVPHHQLTPSYHQQSSATPPPVVTGNISISHLLRQQQRVWMRAAPRPAAAAAEAGQTTSVPPAHSHHSTTLTYTALPYPLFVVASAATTSTIIRRYKKNKLILIFTWSRHWA